MKFIIFLFIPLLLISCEDRYEIQGAWTILSIKRNGEFVNIENFKTNMVTFDKNLNCCSPNETSMCGDCIYKIVDGSYGGLIDLNTSNSFDGRYQVSFYNDYYMRLQSDEYDIHLQLQGSQFFRPKFTTSGYENYETPMPKPNTE